MTGRSTRRALGAIALGSIGVAAWRDPAWRARGKELARDLRRRAGRVEGRADGWLYRVGVGGPDPDAADDIVAERVRATLGPVVHGRDLPHVHVFVERRVAVLHGDVATEDDRRAIEEATRSVTGVAGVESHLHVGLLPSDTRPSAGAGPSPELRRLVDAAARHGGGEATSRVAVKAVLGVLAGILPEPERERLASQLAPDVRELLVPPRWTGLRRNAVDLGQVTTAMVRSGMVSEAHAPKVLEAVLVELRQLVPGEADQVAPLLPPAVRELWDAKAS